MECEWKSGDYEREGVETVKVEETVVMRVEMWGLRRRV